MTKSKNRFKRKNRAQVNLGNSASNTIVQNEIFHLNFLFKKIIISIEYLIKSTLKILEFFGNNRPLSGVLSIIGLIGFTYAVLDYPTSRKEAKESTEQINVLEQKIEKNIVSPLISIDKVLNKPLSRNELKTIIYKNIGEIDHSTLDLVENKFNQKVGPIFSNDLPTYFRAKAIAYSMYRIFPSLAIEVLNDGLKISSGNLAILYERAILKVYTLDLKGAKTDLLAVEKGLLGKSKEHYPAILSVQLSLAALYYNEGNFPEALFYYKKAIEVMPIEAHSEQFDFLILEDVPPYIGLNIQLISLDQVKAQARLKLIIADIYTKKVRLDDSILIIEALANDKGLIKSLSDQDEISFHISNALIFALKKNFDRAESELRLVQNNIPTIIVGTRPHKLSIEYLIARGTIFLYKDKWEKAYQFFRKAAYLYGTYYSNDSLEYFNSVRYRFYSELGMGDLSSALGSAIHLRVLATKRGGDRDKFDAELANGYIAYANGDKIALKQVVISLEELLDQSDRFGAIDRAYLLFSSANLARLDNDFIAAKRYEKRAAALFDGNEQIFHSFKDILLERAAH
jgi:tetratricopeptide (TPR) repeat protein